MALDRGGAPALIETPDTGCPCTLCPAVNFNARRVPKLDMLVLHYTGMVDSAAAVSWLAAGESGVSCHYFVHEDGTIVQMVRECDRAWHAGEAAWRGKTDINSRSIGIEIANPGHEHGYAAFPDRQIEAVIVLCRDILGRHAIPPRNVVAHSDVAPLRKRDPGEKFPWDRLAAEGVGHFVAPVPFADGTRLLPGEGGDAVAGLQALLALYGYELGVTGNYDALTGAVITGFQRHFRPGRVDGIADRSTIATLKQLIAALEL